MFAALSFVLRPRAAGTEVAAVPVSHDPRKLRDTADAFDTSKSVVYASSKLFSSSLREG